MDRNQVSGYVMASLGFLLIFVNALSYLFGLDAGSPAMVVIGIVFLVLGMDLAKKK